MSIYIPVKNQHPNRFYVYAYLRVDGTFYYIGKGSGKRITTKRKNHWPPKDPSRRKILYNNLLEHRALDIEIFLISYYGRIDIGTGILKNQTDGGDGTSGHIKSQETIRKLVEKNSKEYILMTPEGNILNIKNLSKFCKENKFYTENLTKVAQGKRKHYKFWQCKYSDDNSDFYKPQDLKEKHLSRKTYIVKSPTGAEFKVFNLRKFCRENNLHDGNMIKIAKGFARHCKFWQCRYEGQNFFDFFERIELNDHIFTKIFNVTSPEGDKYKVKNLKRFCRENNLNDGTMYDVAKGNQKSHKGWKCKYVSQ